jgi:hypothetical protein
VLLLRADEGVVLAPDRESRERTTFAYRHAGADLLAHPPRHYGPWELVTSLLTEALVARGVDVTLFATRDSQTAGTLAGVCPAPYSEDPSIDAKVWEMLHVAHVFERASEFDLIHNQADFVPLAFSRMVETPVVTTIHGFSSDRILPAFKAYQDRVHYVAISAADRHPDCAMRRRSITGSGWRTFRSIRMAAKTCSSSAASTPTREQPRRSPLPARQAGGWSWPASSRIRAITTRMSRLRSTAVRVNLSRRRRRSAAHENPGLGASPAPPRQFRGALRAVGCGGARLRHTGHRLQARLDAGIDRAWRNRLPGR